MTSPRDFRKSRPRPRVGAGARMAKAQAGRAHMAKTQGGRPRGRLRFAAGAVFGLSLGLGAAFAVHLYHRAVQTPAVATTASHSEGAPIAASRTPPAPPAGDDEIHYDFFDLLPEFKLEIPPPDGVADGAPAAASSKFILQAGAFKTREQAHRQRQKLIGMGYRASVHSFRAADADWHRVWIGPYAKLARANRARLALKGEGVETLLTGR